MYKLSVLLFIFHINLTAQWITISAVPTVNNLNDVYFVNSEIGYIVGDNSTILKTIDGGLTWNLQESGIDNNINSVFFTSDNIGYAVAGKYDFTFRYSIIKTTNGGNDWLTLKNDTGNELQSIFFVNNLKGFASGDSKIYMTSNAGESWTSRSITGIFNSMFFVNQTEGYIVGTGRTIYKTQNGGDSWFPQFSGINSDVVFYSVHFTDSLKGHIVGNVGKYTRTTNGGDEWKSGYFGVSASLNDITFLNDNDGYIVGEYGKIYKTTDSGTNWTEEQSGTFHNLNSINFSSLNIACVVGNNGTILRNDNLVTLVDTVLLRINIKNFELNQNYPNPFNPKTKIKFSIPANVNGEMSIVQLKVYDILSNEIATLVNEQKSPGTYEVEFDGNALTSGIYFYKLSVDEKFSEVKKMLLLK